ncbi:hypothetical protein PRNP1_008251 [Phytophthora ramorum]
MMIRERGAPESWDLSWMAAATQSLETYEAALETAEFPSLLLAALDELLQAPEANAAPLRELSDVLLQMIAFPIDLELPQETVTTLHAARDWAIQTLLDVQPTESSTADVLLPTSKPLQQMQAKLFTSAPCRQTDVQMELLQSLLAAVEDEQEADTLSSVLEMCATSLESDEEFLQFAEAALSGKTEALVLGSGFLQRLFDRRSVPLQADEHLSESRGRRKRRLFDVLALESKIRLWANHLPSWRSQLQTWMLEAHRAPLEPISAVLPDGWCYEDESGAASSASIVVIGACRRYSHLYVTFVEWCRSHVSLLSSCRSMELVSVLSRSTRQENDTKLFNRQLLGQVPMMNHLPGSWSPDQREGAFTALGSKLEQLQTTRSASDIAWQFEWIGVLERPNLLHEALEITFCGDRDGSSRGDGKQPAAHYATTFFSWFYSYSSYESADEIAALLTQISSELKVLDISSGAQWLRRTRADFGGLPILRLRLVWFWLLKSIQVALVTPVPVTTAPTTDVLESVEYIFRRFTPPRAKRPFQVELVTQLLAELEWRATNANAKTKDEFLDGIAPLCAWLTKIVRLMQLEEQTTHQKDSRSRYGGRRSPTNDVQHLAERLEPFLC